VLTVARRRDLTGLAACVPAGCLVVALAWFSLASLDTGYHLAYGGHFLDTGEIVGLDPFLYPENAKPFINANWGSQVVMAAADRLAGPAGLIALRIGLIAIIFAAIAVVVRQMIDSRLAIAVAWMLAALAAYERFSLRPELFSDALLSVQLAILVRGVRTWRSVAALVAIQVAWVNVHSYFLVGLALTGCWFAQALFEWLWSRRSERATRLQCDRALKIIAVAIVLQSAACLANPRHVHGAVFPLRTLAFLDSADVMGGAAGDASKSAWSEISEFQSPFSFLGEPICRRTIHAYIALLGICAAGLVALLVRRRLAEAAAIVLLLLMSLEMRRNIAQFAMVAAPLAIGGIGMWRALWGRLPSPNRIALRRLAAAITIGLCCWWVFTLVSGRFYFSERRISREFGAGYNEHAFCRTAAAWLAEPAQDGLEPYLFVDYFSSSNVLPWLPSRFKLFVDTNTFACEDATLATAFDLVTGRIPHQPVFDRSGVNVVLLRCSANTQALVRRLAADDGVWALVHVDPQAVIFVRRTMAHVDVIRANRWQEADLDVYWWLAEATGPAAAAADALTVYTRANVPMFLGWNRAAVKLLERAVLLAPDLHEAWINLGLCHGRLANAASRQGDFATAAAELDTALECFDKALKLDPGNAIAEENRRRATQSRQSLSSVRPPWRTSVATGTIPGDKRPARGPDATSAMLKASESPLP